MKVVEPTEIDEDFKEQVREDLHVEEDESILKEAGRRNPAIFMKHMLGMEPYYWQARVLTDIGKAVRGESDRKTFVIMTSRQIGKAQPYSEPVLTPTGWTEMKGLKVGDEVIAEDGTPTRVTNIFEQGERDVYKITFTDGSSTRCDKEHLWKYKTSGAKHWKVDTLDRITEYKGGMNPTSDQAVRVPLTQPVEFPEKQHKIHPYTFGALLGDGGIGQDNLSFSAKTDTIPQHINEVDGMVSVSNKKGYCEWSLAPYQQLNKELNRLSVDKKSNSKFIPDEYKYDSVANREALLRGLMDTDGSIYGNCQIEFYSVSQQLAKDVKELVQSLGGTAEIKEKPSWYTDSDGNKQDGQLCYRVKITLYDVNPFHMERKAEKWYPIKYNRTRIVDKIEKVGTEASRCIQVDHPSQTYITDDYIVTHNSTTLSVLDIWACEYNHAAFGAQNRTKVGSFSKSNDQAKKLMREIKSNMNAGDYHMREQHGLEEFHTGLIDEKGGNNKTTITFEKHDPSVHGDVILNGSKAGSEIRTYAPTDTVLGETFSLGQIDEANVVGDYFYDEVFTPTMDASDGVKILTSTPYQPSGFFWEIVNNHEASDAKVWAFTIDALKPDADEGHPQATTQLKSVKSTIDGLETRGKMDTIRRQYYCEFIQGTNQFFDPDDVDAIFTDALEKTKDFDKAVDVGVDFGGSSSSHTVVTVSHFDEERGRIERIWHKRYGVQEDLNLVKDIATLRKIFDVQRIILEQCLDEDTNVLMADNTRKRIADIEAGEYVKSYDFENEEYVNKKVEKVIDNGYQPTEKITFKNGGSVYATGGHRWFTRSKQNKDNIKVQTTNDLDLTNRYIPQLNGMEKSGKTPISEAEAWLMGMYVAEGHSRSKDNAFFIPQFNEDVWVKLRDKLVEAGWTWQYNNDGMYISDAKDVSSLLNKVGKTAYDKHLPEEVFSWDISLQKALFEGLIDGDGSRYPETTDKRGYKISAYTEYYTVSEQLAKDVQLLSYYIGKPMSLRSRVHSGFGSQKEQYTLQYNENSSLQRGRAYIRDREDGGEKHVYDLQVEDTQSFILPDAGVITHNCPQGDYFIRKMDEELGWNVEIMNPSKDKARKYSAFNTFIQRNKIYSYPDEDLKQEMKALEKEQQRTRTKIHAPRNYTDDMIDSFIISCYFFLENNSGHTRSLFDAV